MPITALDVVKSVVGEKDTYTAADCSAAGVAMIGGCQVCSATIALYNAYPSRSGYWRCAACIGGSGFTTIEEFASTPVMDCPCCGEASNIHEVRVSHERTESYVLECGECGVTWTQ